MRITLLLFLLSLYVAGQQGPTGQPAPHHNKNPKQAATQKHEQPPPAGAPDQQAHTQSASQQVLSCNCATSVNAQEAQSAKTETFSALTLFLFASALALFIALLGWSDQIRGIDKDTQELEKRFLEETGVDKRDFLCVIKPQPPGEQLAALAKLMRSNKLHSHDEVDLLSAFKAWKKDWTQLETLSTWKYNLTVALTLMLFLAGIISLFTHPSQQVPLHFFKVRTEMLVLTLPMSLVAVLLGTIIYGARLERALRTLLESIADKV